MNKKKWIVYGGIVAAIAIAAISAPAFADDSGTSIDEMRSEEIRRIVNDVLTDADTRISLSAVESDFTLDVSGFAITRFIYNGGGDVETNHEFGLPYARLQFSGNILDTVDYRVSGEFSDYESGSFELVDAYITIDVAGFDLKSGQFVSSFYTGYTDSPLDLTTGEYSIIANTFGQGRSQGIEFSKGFDALRLSASYNDGFNSDNVLSVNDDYGVSFRADLDLGFGFNLGAAYAHQYESLTDYGTYTVDAGWNASGWDLGVSFVSADYMSGGYEENYGLHALVAYQCAENLQGFVQYQHGILGTSSTNLNVFEVGVNYDINNHVRWTTSVGYALDAVDSSWNLGRTGWSDSGSGSEYNLRTQLSVSF